MIIVSILPSMYPKYWTTNIICVKLYLHQMMKASNLPFYGWWLPHSVVSVHCNTSAGNFINCLMWWSTVEYVGNIFPEKKVSCVSSPLASLLYVPSAYQYCHSVFIIQAAPTIQVLDSKCHAVSVFVNYFCKLLIVWSVCTVRAMICCWSRTEIMVMSDLGVAEVNTYISVGIDLDWYWSLKWLAA